MIHYCMLRLYVLYIYHSSESWNTVDIWNEKCDTKHKGLPYNFLTLNTRTKVINKRRESPGLLLGPLYVLATFLTDTWNLKQLTNNQGAPRETMLSNRKLLSLKIIKIWYRNTVGLQMWTRILAFRFCKNESSQDSVQILSCVLDSTFTTISRSK